MPNAYNNLTTLKSRLDITATTWDTDLLALLVAASRQIDKFCDRFFYVDEVTRYFDGSGTPLFIDDLLSVSTLKLDEDGDATFESTMATTDYILYPLNKYPKTHIKISGNSDYGGFAAGIKKGVEIAGDFGYGTGRSATPYTATSITIVADNATETELDVSAEGTIKAGHTILVESEQIYVKTASADATKKITVGRGVNGTTAAAHATKAASIYDYPEPIMEACLIQAMRWWKRRESAFADVIGVPELGQMIIYKGLDPDLKLIIETYRKRGF